MDVGSERVNRSSLKEVLLISPEVNFVSQGHWEKLGDPFGRNSELKTESVVS